MAIDDTAVQLIKQTAGAIREKSQEINRLVYEKLSNDHKPAYAILHRAGLPPLAGIVASYAASIGNLEPFLEHAPRIAQMHHRIDLQEAHFDMVAAALFSAFRQALGTEAVSEAALQAWRCAYEHLANTLINLQKDIQAPAL